MSEDARGRIGIADGSRMSDEDDGQPPRKVIVSDVRVPFTSIFDTVFKVLLAVVAVLVTLGIGALMLVYVFARHLLMQ